LISLKWNCVSRFDVNILAPLHLSVWPSDKTYPEITAFLLRKGMSPTRIAGFPRSARHAVEIVFYYPIIFPFQPGGRFARSIKRVKRNWEMIVSSD